MSKVIIIKGKGATGCYYPAYLDAERADGNEVELWTLNDDLCIDSDVTFEIHNPPHHKEQVKQALLDKKHYPKLKWCVVSHTLVNSEGQFHKFPIEKLNGLEKLFGLNNSIAYMVALAIIEGAHRIILPGVEYSDGSEIRTRQCECVERWLAYATGKGVEVKIMKGSSLFANNGVYV